MSDGVDVFLVLVIGMGICIDIGIVIGIGIEIGIGIGIGTDPVHHHVVTTMIDTRSGEC